MIASYDGPVTWLARAAILATLTVLVGGWLLALGLRGFYAVRGWRRARRDSRPGYVSDFWPPRSERWFR